MLWVMLLLPGYVWEQLYLDHQRLFSLILDLNWLFWHC